MDRRWTATTALAMGAVVGLAVVTSLDRPERVATDLVESARLVTDPSNALRGTARLATAVPTSVTVELREIDGHGLRVSTTHPAERHEIPLLGLRQQRDYGVRATVRDLDGRTQTVDVGTMRTRSLPDDLPPISVTSDPSRMTPGLTMFDSIYRPPADGDGHRDVGFLTVVDEWGEVVWYHRADQSIQDARRTEDGDLLFVYDETGVRRIAPTGELVSEWTGTTAAEVATEDRHGRPILSSQAIRVDTDQMHHEVVELPNGNLLTLSREVREVTYPEPLCDDSADDGVERVVGDTVVEFEPGSGAIVREYSMFEVLDPLENLPRMVAAEFCSPYLRPRYPDRWPVRDWTHANAVVLDQAHNTLLVSNRHTDQIVALRYEDDAEGPGGALLWRLGEGGDLELTEGSWFLHQHAPEIQADGTLQLYDNANDRPGTDLDDASRAPVSRAVRYRIDLAAGTAQQVWEHAFAPEKLVYAPFVADADTLEGTVLITHGGLLEPPAHDPGLPGLVNWGRIVEVEETTGEVVFDLASRDPDGESWWGIYRAERIPTIYPPDYRVEPLPFDE